MIMSFQYVKRAEKVTSGGVVVLWSQNGRPAVKNIFLAQNAV